MARMVNYSTECPGCKVQGITRTLGFDPEQGGICCDAETPHKYENLPGESEAGKRPDLAEETQQAPTGEPVADDREASKARFVELMQGRKEPSSADLDADAAEKAVVAATEPRPRDFGSQLVGEDPMYGRGLDNGIIKLPNGDVLITVCIKEQWVSAVQAEAEVRGQSFAEYFREFLNEVALMNEWGANVPVDAT